MFNQTLKHLPVIVLEYSCIKPKVDLYETYKVSEVTNNHISFFKLKT